MQMKAFKLCFYLIIIIQAKPVLTHWDLNYGLQLKSRTPTSIAYSELGYAHLLWKTKSTDKNLQKFSYSYIRTSLKVKTALIVNAIIPQLTLAPIAPLELKLGEEIYHSVFNSNVFHKACGDQVQCKSYTRRFYYGASLKLAYTSWVAYLEWQKSHIQHQKGDSVYLHYPTDLVIDGTQTMQSLVAFLGYMLSDSWNLGFLYWQDTIQGTDDYSKFTGLTLAYNLGSWTFTSGLGSYSVTSLKFSDHTAITGASIILEIKKTLAKGLVL